MSERISQNTIPPEIHTNRDFDPRTTFLPDAQAPGGCAETYKNYLSKCKNLSTRISKLLTPSSPAILRKLIAWVCSIIYSDPEGANAQRLELINENNLTIHSPQVPIANFENFEQMQFDTNDVRDAVAIAEASNVKYFNQCKYVDRGTITATSRRKLIDSPFAYENIANGDDRLAMRHFMEKIQESGMFYFENGVIKTASGLQATVTYNTEKRKICIHYHGTDFSNSPRRSKTMAANVKIVTGGVHEMVCEAAILADCAACVFGRDRVLLSGHSLGGSMCQFASAALKIPGISINPAAVNENLLLGLPSENLKFARDNGCQISVKGDPVSDGNLLFLRTFKGDNKRRCVQLSKKS
ncbi:MAG: hypothetical protein LBS87_00525 [Puniceicoccales bacterium]|jgi:hypothetical protein|nr:hypothetical protein [Puniceicoccales bacterium]